jgi:hypothetical protein
MMLSGAVDLAKPFLHRSAVADEKMSAPNLPYREARTFSRADRVQMESSERVKMLEKQSSRAGCVNPCERNML